LAVRGDHAVAHEVLPSRAIRAALLVRWLSRFTVQQRVDHGPQILDALVAEE